MFYSFSDHLKFSGKTPSSSCSNSTYESYHYIIKNCMIKELNKRVATTFNFDASYEESKRSHQHKENSVFKYLAMGMNTFGEV